ncbi:hypothetical protein RI129_009862 [Pyrocoelia pectoralis]|uniref:PHD-type domain-containing protein n=1 Tax=Pyrocoelia pectoralis TaxID=417401 RepID=A0AAN7ZCM9_9COLE
MSGGPPHHSHSRQPPSPNTAWNHLQVPNYYPRQPQHAHMSNEHPLLHQSTWHTPTTEPVKAMPHSHLFNLEQMISERPYPRHSPGVDLSLQKNGNQNGELPTTPISLSVRDANKINSLPVGAVDMQAVELTKSISPSLRSVKSSSPILKIFTPSSPSHPIKPPISPNISSSNMLEKQDSPKSLKRSAKRMDSIIERLNPIVDREKQTSPEKEKHFSEPADKPHSVIVQPVSLSYTEESSVARTSSILSKEEEVTSPYSNEDSTDSNKSRRKRKPAKTIRVSKDIETLDIGKTNITTHIASEATLEENKCEQRRSGSAPPGSPIQQPRIRRKTSSESETIANIAAMIEMSNPEKEPDSYTDKVELQSQSIQKPISVSVIKSKEKEVTTSPVIQTPAQKKMTDTNSFVEVENKLEEMFAGITDDNIDSPKMELNYEDSKMLELDETKTEDTLVKLDVNVDTTSGLNDSVTSTSNDLCTQNSHKRVIKQKSSKARRSSESTTDFSPKKKKGSKKLKTEETVGKIKINCKKIKSKVSTKPILTKADLVKDVYAYDSGSNASSSRSRGPFIQIRGPRESPISVNVVNTPTNDEDTEKKVNKSKKYHDDTEYRHKVRSRGLHCSTLSNKYDAQTRDATWICVFCKRGPHATDPHLSGPSRFNANIQIPPPGDLFGPYIITTDSSEYQRRLDDPYDQQFKSKKVSRAISSVTINKVISKKSKRKHSDSYDSRSSFEGNEDVYLGITETKDKVYEVWAHENCIVWSPGVYLVGPKIIGLEEAVWTSCNVTCIQCRYRGANVCCIKRGCVSVVHVGCAVSAEWDLDEDNYKAMCVAHKVPSH